MRDKNGVKICRPAEWYIKGRIRSALRLTFKEIFPIQNYNTTVVGISDTFGRVDGHVLLPTLLMFEVPYPCKRKFLPIILVAPYPMSNIYDIEEEFTNKDLLRLFIVGRKVICFNKGRYTKEEWRLITEFIQRHILIIRAYQRNEMIIGLFLYEVLTAEFEYRKSIGIPLLDIETYKEETYYDMLSHWYSTDKDIEWHARRNKVDGLMNRDKVKYGYDRLSKEDEYGYKFKKFYKKKRLFNEESYHDACRDINRDFVHTRCTYLPLAICINPLMIFVPYKGGVELIGRELRNDKNYDIIIKSSPNRIVKALNFTIDIIEENIDEIGSAEPDDYRCTETIKESVLRRAREDGYPKIKFRKNPQYIDRDDRIKECVMEDE